MSRGNFYMNQGCEKKHVIDAVTYMSLGEITM